MIKGKHTNAYGDEYYGEFDEQERYTGKAQIECSNGTTYTGDFREGIRCGYGKQRFLDNSVYEGEFADNCPNGQGRLILFDGDERVGLFVNGEFRPKK